MAFFLHRWRLTTRFAGLSSVRFVGSAPEKVEYVHPLSQLVLEHLQTTRADWIEKNGLDKGLNLQRDGTFVLKFPSFDKDEARIW